MVGQRQKPAGDLVNRRGGRGQKMIVPGRKVAPRRVPALPEEVRNPRAVWLPAEVLQAFARTYQDRSLAIFGDHEDASEIRRRIREEAMAELAVIGERAQKLAKARWRQWWTSDPASGCKPEDEEALRWWIIQVFERALFAPVVAAMPLMMGANGGYVRNPLARHVKDASAEIARVERAYGMTLQAKFQLQLESEEDQEEDEMESAMRRARID